MNNNNTTPKEDRYRQAQNPITNNYVKIDIIKGAIVARNKKPFKNIKIIGNIKKND